MTWFTTGVLSMEGGGGAAAQNVIKEGAGLSQSRGGAWGELKMLSKNTCKGVHLIKKLPACKPPNLLKMNFFTHIFQGF